MIFGSKDHFAIECHVRSRHGGFVIGDLWLWADAIRIGDEISGVDLPLVLGRLSKPLLLKGHRSNDFFDRLDNGQVAEFFHKRTFTEEEISETEELIGHHFARYLVISAPSLEGFDSLFVALIGRGDGCDRLIWKSKGAEAAHGKLLDLGEYDTCVLSCLDWLEVETGYRSWEREWLCLDEVQRDALRKVIVARRPQLAGNENRERLEQAVIAEFCEKWRRVK